MSSDGQQNNVAYDFGVPVQPVAAAAWRGRLNIPCKNIGINIAAHVSNKACMKVLEVANTMPESIYLETVPQIDVWPLSFESSPPTEHSIELFFFPEGRDDEALDSLITEALCSGCSLKAMIGKTELLIFTSHQLPEKLHRFLGKHYLWGVFRGQQAPSNQSDFHIQVQNTKARQTSYSNSDDHRSFEGYSTIAISSKHSPSHATKSDRRGRHLDDDWIHARPLDELRQKTECRYCGFISSHGGISRLKAHLGGGNTTVHLPGCDKVPPDLKQAMANWFSEWVRNTKAVWAKGIKAAVEPEQPDDISGRPHVVWDLSKPFDETGRQMDTNCLNFGSLDGAMLQLKVQMGLRDQKMQLVEWPKVSPKVKSGSSKKSMTSKAHEIKGLMSELENNMTAPKMKKSEAGDQQAERRGRPLDDAWKHVKALDAARQKTQCNYCGFVSSYGGISRLKAHLGGGSAEMQLQGCPRVPLEVNKIMEQWFDEWAKTSLAAWTRKPNGGGPVKPRKRSKSVDDHWVHAMPLDELGQATKCKYCGFVSKCGGIEQLKVHLGGGDQTMQLEACTNVPAEIRSSMVKEIKKHRKKAKRAHMLNLTGVLQGETVPSNTQLNDDIL